LILGNVKKYALITCIIVLLCGFGVLTKLLFDFVGNPTRAEEIYKQALTDFNAENYSNAYFQFSKVSYLSDLKPYAIFHRAECAKALGDTKSEMKQYYLLFNVYPKNELSTRAKYLWSLDNTENNPKLSQKMFEEIIQTSPESDWAMGAKYQIASILNERYKNSLVSSAIETAEITDYLRDYLTNVPAGKWSIKSANMWLNLTDNIDVEDRLLLAQTYLNHNLPDKADIILLDTDNKYTWAKKAKIALAVGDKNEAKALIEEGLPLKTVSESEKNEVLTKFIQTYKDKTKAIDSIKANDIFLKTQRCKYTDKPAQKNICYAKVLKENNYKTFSEPILFDVFIENIAGGQYSTAKQLGLYFLSKYNDSQNADLVTFWIGNICKHERKTFDANEYFKKVILKYPDSYYAFRSYLKLNDLKNSIITTKIEPKEVYFPYNGRVSGKIAKLVDMKDYDILAFVYENDKFVQSWILYEKGEKSKAMCMARDAMMMLEEKPDKSDLRWRLVYPTFLYDEMQKYAKMAGNNPVLMMALTREESYFNENAKSYVGAVGLMQIMPETANEINRIKNLGMSSLSELQEADTNLKLGNYYYNMLLKSLGENNILAVAAYNGGIGSTSRWKKGLDYRDIDEFVEKIPYGETRTYVRKVFRTYWNYARLYL